MVKQLTGGQIWGYQFLSLDGKSHPDLFTWNLNSISLYTNNGDGTFSDPVTMSTGENPFNVVIGDFNNDGLNDFAVVNAGDSTVSVYLRKS